MNDTNLNKGSEKPGFLKRILLWFRSLWKKPKVQAVDQELGDLNQSAPEPVQTVVDVEEVEVSTDKEVIDPAVVAQEGPNSKEYKIALRKDCPKEFYGKVVDVFSWKEYANNFEKVSARLNTSPNLYQIENQKFLRNSKLQPIFFPKNTGEINVKEIDDSVNINDLNFAGLDLSYVPKTLKTVRKVSNTANTKKIVPVEVKLPDLNKKISFRKQKPLSYYTQDKLRKHKI